MRGADMDNRGPAFHQVTYTNAGLVKTGKRNARSVTAVYAFDGSVAWVFKTIDFISSEEFNDKPVKIFGTGSDDDLLGGRRKAAKGLQVFGDGPLQLGHASRAITREQNHPVAGGFTHELGPNGKRKTLRIGVVSRKFESNGNGPLCRRPELANGTCDNGVADRFSGNRFDKIPVFGLRVNIAF